MNKLSIDSQPKPNESRTQLTITTFTFAAIGILIVLLCMTRHFEYDLWWHLKIGELIALNKSIPLYDTFSHTFAGQPQYTGEWLADLLFYEVFRAWGFLGLNIFKAAIIMLTFLFVARTSVEQIEDKAIAWQTIAITLLVALFAVKFRFYVRPYLFTMLFTSIFIYLIESRKGDWYKRYCFILPLLMLFWVNLSVGAVFGVVIVVMAAFDDFIRQRSLKLSVIAVLTLLASLINTEGYNLYALALNLTTDPYRVLIPEYSPFTFEMLLGSGFVSTLAFKLLLIGALVYFLALRGWKNLFRLGLFGFFLYETFRQFRLVEVFSIIAAPYFAICLSRALSALNGKLTRYPSLLHVCTLATALIVIPATFASDAGDTYGYGVKNNVFPDRALQFLKQNRISGKMFNSYAFGGYFIWNAPDRPVFIDGRYRRIYPPSFAGEFLEALLSPEAWARAESKYGFDYAVLSHDFLQQKFPGHLMVNPDWVIVYWDRTAVVMVKRNKEREELISKYAYQISRPTSLDFSYLDKYVQSGATKEALAQLEIEMARNRENQIPVLASLYLLHQDNKPDYQRMLRLMQQIMPLHPDFAMKHSAYAQLLLETGQKAKYEQELAKALALDPTDPGAVGLSTRFKGSKP